MQTTLERLNELRRYADALESDLKRQTTTYESQITDFESRLTAVQQEKLEADERAMKAEAEQRESEERWKTDNDKLQVKLLNCPANSVMKELLMIEVLLH
jgi:hypothetical protein